VLVVFVLVCLISVLIALFLCHRAKRDNLNCNNKPTVTSYYTSSSGSSAPVTTSPSPQVYARRLGSQLRYSLSSGLTRSWTSIFPINFMQRFFYLSSNLGIFSPSIVNAAAFPSKNA
jgi:hypothetical protein